MVPPFNEIGRRKCVDANFRIKKERRAEQCMGRRNIGVMNKISLANEDVQKRKL